MAGKFHDFFSLSLFLARTYNFVEFSLSPSRLKFANNNFENFEFRTRWTSIEIRGIFQSGETETARA